MTFVQIEYVMKGSGVLLEKVTCAFVNYVFDCASSVRGCAAIAHGVIMNKSSF